MRVGHVCPFGKNLMSVSRDGGKTWSAPAVINDSWLDDRDAGICSMGSGRFVLSYFNHPVQLYRKRRNWIGSFTDAFSYGMTMGTLDTYASYTAEMNHAGSFIRISVIVLRLSWMTVPMSRFITGLLTVTESRPFVYTKWKATEGGKT